MVVCRERLPPMQREMVEEDINEVVMEEQQNAPPEVSNPESISMESCGNWSDCVKVVREARERALMTLVKAKIAKEVKGSLEKEWALVGEVIEKLVKEISHVPAIPKKLIKGIADTLTQRGIESEEEWEEYIKTVEKDGELISELCEMFETDIFQLKHAIEERCRKTHDEEDPSARRGKQVKYEHAVQNMSADSRNIAFQETACPTSPTSACSWQKHGTTQKATSAHVDTGTDANVHLVNYLRAMACADPGVYKGSRGENFQEFVRKFKRKYVGVISCEETLIEILGDDHLAGRAKNIFTSLPSAVKEGGLEVVTRVMARLLACDSTASRMRALTELKNLRIRPGQEVAEFCVVLEKIGKQAYPERTPEDKSMEYAQILLDNLSAWPEHVQLIGALHRVEPNKAYEEIKQLAISIEQSKIVLGTNRKSPLSWKTRYTHYQSGREQKPPDSTVGRSMDFDRMVDEGQEARSRNRVNLPSPGNPRRERDSQKEQSKKCYHCSRFGHFARECPTRAVRVNSTAQRNVQVRDKEAKMSSIIEGCRSLGMATREDTGASDLIGTQIVMEINLLEESHKALVDTGSMISIIPIEVLAKAQERGFDVDTLSVVPKAKLRPVFDASNNRMNFEGAVYIHVDTKSGHSGLIPFHISPTKEAEVIIGTNALSRLGVEVSINRKCKPKEELNDVNKGNHVVVMKRLYIPPHNVSLVPVKCEGDLGNDKERVIWPCKQGVEPGVYLIKDRETTIPVFNTGTDPLILKEGENVGHWETDKWHDQWEDLNPLLSDEVDHELSGNERLQKLEELLSASTEAQKLDEEVKLLLKKYQGTFSISDRELTQTNLVKMTIDTGDCAPIKMRARPVPLGLRPKLKELLTDLLERKVIEHSKSEWAFPIVLVEKKDGSNRLGVDYRELNKKNKLDAYPLPSIEALLQSLSGKRFSSVR